MRRAPPAPFGKSMSGLRPDSSLPAGRVAWCADRGPLMDSRRRLQHERELLELQAAEGGVVVGDWTAEGPFCVEKDELDLALLASADRGRPPDSQRWRFAVHEASHAVVAYLLGRGPEYVEIDPGGGGRCKPTRVSTETLVAGAAGEQLAWGGPSFFSPGALYRWSGDLDAVRRRSDAVAAPEIMRSVRRTLADHWPAVRAVSEALHRRGRLHGHEVRSIVEQPGIRES